MKRYLLLGIAMLMLVVSVSGLALDFQNPSDFSAQVSCTGVCTWNHNTTGGNSYIYSGGGIILNPSALAMTYTAGTIITPATGYGNTNAVVLYDSGMNIIYSATPGAIAGDRIEIKMIGGNAYIYTNGVQQSVSGLLAANPSYVGFGGNGWSTDWDDIIWGSTESKYIFGIPENGYFLMKDILNPSASGFYRVNQTSPTGAPTLIASNSMTSTFGKGSGDNETLCLENYGAGCYQNYYTGTAYAGVVSWNLTAFFESTAPYGLYDTTIRTQVPSTAPYVVSDTIPYIGSGASIQFDKNSYAIGETALLTVVVSDSYYNTATYSYHVVIQDIYGTEVYDAPISFSASPHTGTASYQWATTDNEGVYYGLIYAKRISDNVELLMNYDTADLNSNLIVNGYVKNAETTNVISGATVNVTQGVTTDSLTTAADGNYSSTSAFSANQPTTIVASKTAYETYSHTFTPLYAGTIQINLTLMPTSPTYTGIALGGIARTPPYNRTIDSALVTITNTSAGTYTATTNSAGYYIQNSMSNGSVWNIWGSKIGFSNSSIYQKLVVGI